jgi:hopanoid biosynthesis associated RND transporter like protein HpnN
MKRLTDETWMARALALMARAAFRYRRTIIWAHVILFVLSIIATKMFLLFDVSKDNLVGSNKRYHQNYIFFEKEFPHQSDLVTVIESEDSEKNRQFAERLGAKLEAETNAFSDVFYKGDLKMMGHKALLFVPESDLNDLKEKLHGFKPFLTPFTRTTNLVSLFDMMNTQFRTAKREQNDQNTSLMNALPAVERIISQATASVIRSGTPPSPGITALFDAGEEAEQQQYITYAKGRIFLVTCKPIETKPLDTPAKTHAEQERLNAQAIKQLRQLVLETKLEVPGLNVGVTGEPILDYDEMQQSQHDTTVASIVSLVICALIFIYGYNETGRPIKATICLVFGLAFTFAFATVTVGHLNILTITFLPMLIGLAIDFGVHLITRYEEELRYGKSKEAALTKAMVFTGQGIFTGASTTAFAFLAMGLTNFKGIQEMGIICGGGLLICFFPMMLLLPVLLLRGRQNEIDHLVVPEPRARAKIESIWLNHPIPVIAITAILTGVAALQMPKLYFDYNLLHMQSAGLPAVEFEQKLIDSAGKSVLYAAIIATNLDQATRLEQQITNLPSVAKKDGVISMAHFLNEDQSGKLRLIGEIKQELAGIHFAPPDENLVNISELSRTLYSFHGYLGNVLEVDEVRTNLSLFKQLSSLNLAVGELRKAMWSGNTNANSIRLAQYQQALFNDIGQTFTVLQNQDNSSPLRVEDLPRTLRDRFIGVTGKYLLQVYPEKDVWDRKNQGEFISQLRGVDPNVTGTPVQLYEYTELLKESYEQAALYSLGAIVLLVIIHFRSLSSVLIALLPVAIGSVWLGGMMAALDVPLNPANIMTLPLVLGIGVTNGIHILNRFAEEQNANILARSTGKAVFVSGLTAIAGFGSLVLAKHQGIQSLGYVMAAGVTTCMIAGLTFLPALLNWMLRNKQPSAGNAQPTLGREEPRHKSLK